MSSKTTRDMSHRHETHLADVLDGRMTRGSGSTWHDKADGKHRHGTRTYAFAWDGKSTTGKSIGVSVAMWDKIVEDADGMIPMIPLRFYADTRLSRVTLDLVALELDTVVELLEDAELGARARAAGWQG